MTPTPYALRGKRIRCCDCKKRIVQRSPNHVRCAKCARKDTLQRARKAAQNKAIENCS